MPHPIRSSPNNRPKHKPKNRPVNQFTIQSLLNQLSEKDKLIERYELDINEFLEKEEKPRQSRILPKGLFDCIGCNEIKYNNKKLIETACWWHDVGRLFSPIHEDLSGQIARANLLGLGFDSDKADMVYQAIRFHKWKMIPKTLEGHILRDADKLDFISIKRWKKCLKERSLEHIVPIVELLPKLREILKLKASKEIYDKEIFYFLKELKKIKTKNKEGKKIIQDVLDYF